MPQFCQPQTNLPFDIALVGQHPGKAAPEGVSLTRLMAETHFNHKFPKRPQLELKVEAHAKELDIPLIIVPRD
jgi:hypothetical protein